MVGFTIGLRADCVEGKGTEVASDGTSVMIAEGEGGEAATDGGFILG